jgi:sRNA-binding protein
LNGLLAALRGCCPEAFCEPPSPLAIGIHTQVIDLVGEGYAKKDIAWVLRWWCSRPDYLGALSRGEPRRNLDGSIAGKPTPQQRDYAAVAVRSRLGLNG